MKRIAYFRLTASAMCLALCIVLPFLTGQIREIGRLLSPMHFPVLLCGLLCGWQYGLAVGFVAPLLRSLLFYMPPLFPSAVGMAFELATYGAVSALLYAAFRKKSWAVYPALIGAMILGRAFQLVLLGVGYTETYSFGAFLASYVTGTLPGIILQLVFIPPVALLVEKMKDPALKN